MATAAPLFFSLLHALLVSGDTLQACGARWVMTSLPGAEPALPDHRMAGVIRAELGEAICRTALARFEPPRAHDTDGRWALAHVLSWLRVAGGSSVLPPWTRHRYPQAGEWLAAWRDTPCDDARCAWCTTIHQPEKQLKRYFGFDGFRPLPPAPAGGSLQREVIYGGLRNESLLAILPTGGGKSLCFQLPALVRHYRRGQLTVVISPLQALMKDQVDGLIRRTGMRNVAALYGMLTLPERSDVLRRIAMGDIALLYLSPEQLRSKRVQTTLASREIGCWVMDEAHCLSKWGHDFRPDYLYAGRFIRELAQLQNTPIPPIACFTATAKQDVIGELVACFRNEAVAELVRYEGGVERDNLRFYVQMIGPHAKLQRIHELIGERLDPAATQGSAVVFRTHRHDTERTADFLCEQGWRAGFFHAGLPAPEKKRVQEAFLRGEIQVICATNAFGMGIDKEDVRLVVHGDTPGSIENYLQEAGRAGRDCHPADCILLYNEEDCDNQFRLGALTQLTRKDIAQILRGLRNASRKRASEEVVITTGEILRDEDLDIDIDAAECSADNRVRAALSWLERSGFIERNENRTHVIQARPLVQSMEAAERIIAALDLSRQEAGLWRAVLRELMNAEITDSITVDHIALLPEFRHFMGSQRKDSAGRVRERPGEEYASAKVLKVLQAMSAAQLIKKDTLLTAYLHYKVGNHSGIRLARVRDAERTLLDVLAEQEPDPEGWLPLDARLLNHELLRREVDSSPELVGRLLASIGADGRGFAAQTGSLELRPVGRDRYRVRVLRPWPGIRELAERRNRVSRLMIDLLLSKIPEGTPPRKDLLVEFSFEELERAVAGDLELRADIKDMLAAIERGLLFLHEQQVIVLQQGLSIFRSAMTVRVCPDQRRRTYTVEDYTPLDLYYRERIFQVHVMNAYAQFGMEKMDAALRLVLSYFSMAKEAFIHAFFSGNREWLERATTESAYRRIVDDLANKRQAGIVTAPLYRNLLVLAGPGAGKTRVVVHRCAYLLRVKRVKPRAILVCCFNHKAAVELRRRLADLVGSDAYGVTVQTYHSLALRLLGRASAPVEGDAVPDFDAMIRDAVAVLKGEVVPAGMETDEVRDRLLAGYEFILVDEYQDIDQPQYELISAIAGRRLQEDRRLNIFAVGDDDQNIYTFRGANIAFIRRFQEDYEAETRYLTDNYRSTRYIIEAANTLIAHNRDRMKTGHPIGINDTRALLPPGGLFGAGDRETRGRVSVVRVRDPVDQASAIVQEIQRLNRNGVEDWSRIAVLARHRQDLVPVRALLEAGGIPVAWPLEPGELPPLHRFREIRAVIEQWKRHPMESVTAEACLPAAGGDESGAEPNPWCRLLRDVLEDWKLESGNERVPYAAVLDYVFESLAQRRRDEHWGQGVALSTVHAAKGMEYPHVCLCGAWSANGRRQQEEERRAFYVGMTRARETLTLFERTDRPGPFVRECRGIWTVDRHIAVPRAPEALDLYDCAVIPLAHLFLDYAGRMVSGHPVHQALAALNPGDMLEPLLEGDRIYLCARDGQRVASLAIKGVADWKARLSGLRDIRVLGLFTRMRQDVADPSYARCIRCDRWEIPFCEVRFHATGGNPLAAAEGIAPV